ncbi:hypothetical protein GF339_10535 [candidate division KSB3 bacterium]|uniref:Cobalamin-binding protein n=1 Tax=candidate division KSB3 bacterium TaxID=2044937 RepID=A0A9D5JW44_9BACT|nr:hypothetical protein [candidate division KSB3 bacterium]MBD3325012.1 hypothetical protein [candidate division KSB3 bacterium]
MKHDLQQPDFERYITALRGEEPDRVPLGDWNVSDVLKSQYLGKPVTTWQNRLEFARQVGYDFLPASSGIFEFLRSVKAMLADEAGQPEGSARTWFNEHGGIITTWEQFEQFPWPSVDDLDLSVWETFDAIIPENMKALLILGKIYTPVWMLMGAEGFFDALETNQELVAAIFDKIGQIQYETLLRVIEHPCVGAVTNPDDIAHNSGLLIHPKHLRKYLFPWYKKIASVCRDKGLGCIYHSDGDCTEVLPDIVACGFHGFNPIQPNCMDIVDVKQQWGDSLCLIGNINLDSTLTLGTPDDVRAEVYERIRTIGPGGGYMVSSSNSVPEYVPFENMQAMFDATLEFGRYPIDLEPGRLQGKVWTFQGKPKGEHHEITSSLDLDQYVSALLSNDTAQLRQLVQRDLDTGMGLQDVINQGMVAGMTQIGDQFQTGEIFIPEMMIAAKTMSDVLADLKQDLAGESYASLGTVLIGTVKGDMHDIGKNLVLMTLEGHGFTVEDLGVSVNPEQIVEAVKQTQPQIIALSALLTTTMVEMQKTIDALQEAGLRDTVKIIVGGAPLTQSFADQIGADGYAYDAPGAAQKCKELLALTEK